MNIVGGTMACLVAAWSATRAGRSVRLFLPPQGAAPGFRGLSQGPYHLELGTRLVEATPGPHHQPLASYEVGAPVRAFAPVVRQFLDTVLGNRLRPLPPALSVIGGQCVPDFTSSLDFTSLVSVIADTDCAAMRRELLARVDSPDSRVLSSGRRPDFGQMSLSDASIAQHGPTFHDRVITPYAEGVWTGWRHALASRRQKLWIPLFYPETVLRGLDGELHRQRASVVYEYPVGFGMRALVDALLRDLDGTADIVTYDDARNLPVIPDLCGLSVREALRLTAQDPGGTYPLSVAWFAVPLHALRREAAFIAFFDRHAPGFRLSFGGVAPAGEAILTVEGRQPPSPLALGQYLQDIDVLDRRATPHLIHHIRPSLVAPTAENVAKIDAARAMLWTTTWVGPMLGLYADTLNEQIVQGLQAGARLMRAA